MSNKRLLLMVISLGLLLSTPVGAQTPITSMPGLSIPNSMPATTTTIRTVQPLTCVVYPLADVGTDPQLGAWIASTLPVVIQPTSWNSMTNRDPTNNTNGDASVRYYEAGRILVVYQTPAAHSEIATFINNIRKAMPAESTLTPQPTAVTQAAHIVPPASGPAEPGAFAQTAEPRTLASSQPRHLFHIILDGLEYKSAPNESGAQDEYRIKNFTIRYEGEGIIDSHIVELYRLGAIQSAKEAVPANLAIEVASQVASAITASSWHQPNSNVILPPPSLPPQGYLLHNPSYAELLPPTESIPIDAAD